MTLALVLLALSHLFHDVTSTPMNKRILSPDESAGEQEHMSKILNGEYAKPGEFPFAVSLEVLGSHFCGGSVVSRYWIVSAAHCFVDSAVRNLVKARVGSTKSGSGGSLHDVEEIIDHPNFDDDSIFDNDISLLKVKQYFELGREVKAVKVAHKKLFLDDGAEVISAGWGITVKDEARGVASPDLMKVALKVLDRKKCNNMSGIRRLRQLVSTLKVTPHMMCARSAGKDTTKGDSGGPLLSRQDGELVLVGVVSWGEGQGDAQSPGVYTDVAKFEKWIYWTMHPKPQTSPSHSQHDARSSLISPTFL